jgi:hypothetical protein
MRLRSIKKIDTSLDSKVKTLDDKREAFAKRKRPKNHSQQIKQLEVIGGMSGGC